MRYFIGDIHGKDHWREVADVFNPVTDTCYVLGDYFDSKVLEGPEVPFSVQLQNFYDLCDWAMDHEDKVFLLYGNHDTQYLFPDERNNGYIGDKEAAQIRTAFMSYTGMFQFYYVDDHTKTIVSHAGISEQFVKSLSELHTMTPQQYSYDHSNGYSPIWIRPEQLLPTAIKGYNQVVGHTPTLFLEDNKADEEIGVLKRYDNIWFVDTVGLNILALDDTPIVSRETKRRNVSRETTGNIHLDRSLIMRRAHQIRKADGVSMSVALKQAWAEAREGREYAAA